MPANAYLKKSAESYPIAPSLYPLPKAEVTFSGNKAELYVGSEPIVVAEDNAPYVYRQSPQNKSAVDVSLVGGTIAWNQLADNSNTPNNSMRADVEWSNHSSYFTLNGTANTDEDVTGWFELSSSKTPQLSNHVLFIAHKLVSGTISNNSFGFSLNRSQGFIKENKEVIVKYSTATASVYAYSNGAIFNNANIQINVIDLTQAFGSTIADYIYTLEQATAGSGIAWLKSYGFLTKDYYAYDRGSLESVNVASRKVVGKNLLEVVPFSNWTASNPYLILKPKLPQNTLLTISLTDKDTSVDVSGLYFGLMEADYESGTPTNYVWILERGTSFSSKSNLSQGKYLTTLAIYPNSESAYNKIFSRYNVQIELGTTATAYEPYTSTTYDLSGQHEVKRKFGVVDLGSLSWGYSAGAERFYAQLPINSTSIIQPCMCEKYLFNTNTYNDSDRTDKVVCTISQYVYIRDSSYTNETTFKTAMNGVYLVYELATPTTETVTNPELRGVLKLDANNNLYYYGDVCSDIPNPQFVGSTEEFTDATRDVMIPCGQDSNYANSDIYISYGTSPIDMAKEHAIIPYASTYIDSNGSDDVEYWEEVVS